jgi:aconitate hydratase 2/2-methylisocitrate dehydratase
LVRFKGEMQPGITLRDLVHAIPYYAIQKGLLTVEKKGKKNIFSGQILEIEGLENLTVEQAFELSDASAERSAAGCTIKLGEDTIAEYLRSNIVLLRSMIAEGYGDARTLERRARKMEEWLAQPELLAADHDAEYLEVIEIDLADVNEPIVCAPNDPDDARKLSEVAGDEVNEVFIGSCMTNIGHFRAAGKLLEAHGKPVNTRMWICPPTRMDEQLLMEEGYFSIFGKAGARTEMPGCSLCMGNQARVEPGSTVLSTSTRNFPNRLGDGSNVYLTSAELAAIGALLGRLPSPAEYLEFATKIDSMADEIYRYMNFDQVIEFQQRAEEGGRIAAVQIDEVA